MADLHNLYQSDLVLEVEGRYYGFSGCHRYEAHQLLGKETIRCRVRRAPRSVLRAHMA